MTWSRMIYVFRYRQIMLSSWSDRMGGDERYSMISDRCGRPKLVNVTMTCPPFWQNRHYLC